ncbi:hypothetical protein FN846DRAFT_187975 [Sphaerosporella brunnea]|uniref:Uncharacterized protein n=1 Tax=Sphaerosporella brunnea TaxID=1250544 RepID=A0A5J5EQC2_9PEZI|nr:hypothetical protein FN846DRAFT_187975 [Sphaerosporella brunnea]
MRNARQESEKQLHHLFSNTSGRRGGRGGLSVTSGDPPGSRGSDAEPGAGACLNLALDGRISDLNAEHICVFPEHCQMLLNKADARFFAGTTDSLRETADIYIRLIERLGCLLALQRDLGNPFRYNATVDNEARAIRYWGLRPNFHLDPRGPLRDSIKLGQDQSKLQDEFEQCLQRWNIYPS